MTSEEERTYRHAMNEESELQQKLSLSMFRVFPSFYGNGITFDQLSQSSNFSKQSTCGVNNSQMNWHR